MRILITGAGGYIGRHLVPRLRAEGHEVIGWYHHPTDNEGDWFGELSTECRLSQYAGQKSPPDTVIHLAGRVEINLLPNPKGAHLPPIPGPYDIGALYRDNVLATANILQYCLQAEVKHLIFASTQAVYGMHDHACDNCGDECSAEPEPLEYYASSKRAAEKVLEIGRKQGLRITILRLPGVYGGDRKNGAVYNMCRDALLKGEILVTHPYPIPMNVMHIEDVTEAFVASVSWQSPEDAMPEDTTMDISDMTMDISGRYEGCSLNILADEIASLVPRYKVWHGSLKHPEIEIDGAWAQRALKWTPKPRKERLAQVLEGIRRGS